MIRRKKFYWIVSILLIAIVLGGLAGECLASNHEGGEHGEHASEPWYSNENLWKLINVAVLFTVLFILLKAPLKSFFGDRALSIAEALKSAEEQREKAQKDLAEMKERFDTAKGEIDEIILHGRKDAQNMIANIKKDTLDEMELVKKRTSDELQQELIDVRRELVTFVANKAVRLARQKINKLDKTKLQDKYLDKFQKTLNAQGGNGERP